MATYECKLALEVEADSPGDAAREAEATIGDPARGAFVWTIHNLNECHHGIAEGPGIDIDAEQSVR